jgi:hypothetical protein
MDAGISRSARHSRRHVAFVALLVALAGAGVSGADRDAKVITPANSPVELDPLRAFLFDTPLLAVGVRNRGSSPVSYALRIWIFQANGDLKGMLDYCAGDELGGSMRGRVNIPIDIKGVTLRDRAVVAVVRAGSAKSTWTLSESDAEQVESARRASNGSGSGLSFDKLNTRDAVPWTCPCDCPAVQAACGQICPHGAAAFTCAPFGGTCTASCSCK